MASSQIDVEHKSPTQDTSNTPSLGETRGDQDPQGARVTDPSRPAPPNHHESEDTPKADKRRFLPLGKKSESEKSLQNQIDLNAAPIPTSFARPTSAPYDARGSPPSPQQIPSSHPYQSYSPNRPYQSSSPTQPSPASSQIFERSVQDDALPVSTSPAIPAHIQTENHIPPVLEASSLAITNDHLNPDEVEIVTHAGHQPASVTVTGTGTSTSEPLTQTITEDVMLQPEHSNEDGTSTYGSLDTTDVRRLSFISFADVVHSEHAEQTSNSHDPLHLAGLSSMSPIINRSPSPIRAPVSPLGPGGSPPTTSGAPSLRGVRDLSPAGHGSFRGPGSPASAGSPTHGELTIETMRQALRKTASGDMSSHRSAPSSAVGGEDGSAEHPFR
ncbi:MAG: hypothetical protein M1825_000644 [Sarcosagium campestre]|nr:MAG: hypothetical protein M1825_000644 [Sarcosagium campestre]